MHEVRPARVFLWLDHLGAMCSRAWRAVARYGASAYVKVIMWK